MRAAAKEVLARLSTGSAVVITAAAVVGLPLGAFLLPWPALRWPVFAFWLFAEVWLIGSWLAQPAYPPIPDSLDEDREDNPTWNF